MRFFTLSLPRSRSHSRLVVITEDGIPINEDVYDRAVVSVQVCDQLHECRIRQTIVLELQSLDMRAALEHLEERLHAVGVKAVPHAIDSRRFFGTLLLVETANGVVCSARGSRLSEDGMQLDTVQSAKHAGVSVERALWLVLFHVEMFRLLV